MRRSLFVVATICAALPACGASMGGGRDRAPLAAQWFDRAKASYRSGDFDDASEAVRRAGEAAPHDADIKELAARVALVRLDFAEALRLTEGLGSPAAHGIRGRAYWFSGDLEHAADELEAMLTDPKVKDAWARDVAGLARRGAGRHPFELDGNLVASVEMPRSLDRVPLGSAHVVPCELDGERILALVATGSSEVVLDANTRHEAAWVNLRFDRLEVKDVPALVQDLSPITRQLGVPIKALLGAQLLRHAHATVDRRGDQFVVRRLDATAPPDASRVPLYYLRGGGMVLRAEITPREGEAVPFFVDSSRAFPLLLRDSAWKKAGVDVHTLAPFADAPNVKRGTVPVFRVGGFDLAKMPAVQGVDLGELNDVVDVDLGGVIGADLLAFFRVTFGDDGHFMWMEADPALLAPEPSTNVPGRPASSQPAPPSSPTTRPSIGPTAPAPAAPAGTR
ncbi:MAG: hypothetical protein M3O36_08740 [Myxococcota bacterium]|nr:hypothetical protein [Myxococcota bacterium]